MQYEKEIVLKDGTECLLRGASEADAAEVLRIFGLTHAETDYLLTYPEENSFTVGQEAEFLKERSEGKKAIEIAAFVDGRIAGTADIDPIDDKEKIRHRADIVRTSASPLKEPTGGAASGRLLRLRASNARSKRDTCK